MGVGPGSSTTSEVPMETNSESSASAAATPASPKEKKYYIDSTFITPPREGVEIVSPLKDGLGKKRERKRDREKERERGRMSNGFREEEILK